MNDMTALQHYYALEWPVLHEHADHVYGEGEKLRMDKPHFTANQLLEFAESYAEAYAQHRLVEFLKAVTDEDIDTYLNDDWIDKTAFEVVYDFRNYLISKAEQNLKTE